MQWVITAAACTLLLVFAGISILTPVNAVTVNTTLRPISTVSNTNWTGTGTANGTCTGICDYIDETTSDGDTSYLNGTAGQAPTATFGIGGSTTSGQTATSIVVHVVGRSNASSGLGYPPITVSLTINGGTTAAPNISFNTTSYQDLTATFTGTWTKSMVDAATVTVAKGANGLQPAVRVSMVYAAVTYQAPIHDQDVYRVYANADNINPGTPTAATNTTAERSADVPFRLRIGVKPSDVTWETGSWGAHNNTYKLQYAQLTAASCAAQATGWTDVASASGAIRWYNNPSVADNAAIASIGANDPTTSGTKVYQTYRESNGFTNTSNIATGNTGIWDFSLVSSGQPAGLSFCFRIIMNDGSVLNAYTTYPRILLTGDLGVSIVDASGVDVTTPIVPFSSTVTTTTLCNTSTATLGVSSQRIRVTNALVTNGWNVSIAATAGPTSLWNSGASFYDYNDSSGCSDGGDSDSWGGRLTVNPSTATVTPSGSCTSTGVSKGVSTAFSEGTTNAITLLSADASSQRFCYWDVTGVALSQQVPARTQAGSYNLDMTVTVTAQ